MQSMANRQYRKFQKQALSVSGFIAFTALLWLALKLNSQYLVQHKINVQVMDSKTNTLMNAENDSVVLTYKSNGWRVMFPKIMLNQTLVLESSKLRIGRNQPYISLRNYAQRIKESLNYTNEIINFSPDTLYLSNVFSAYKKVPVRADIKVAEIAEHTEIGIPVLFPDSVIVYGNRTELEQVSSVSTLPISIDRLEQQISLQSQLNTEWSNLSLSHKEVVVDLPLKQYTEYSMTIPVQDLIYFNNLQAHPAKVEVVYKSTLNNTQSLDYTDLELSPLEEVQEGATYQKVLFEIKSKSKDLIVQRPLFVELKLIRK
jgi:hypothetical protein